MTIKSTKAFLFLVFTLSSTIALAQDFYFAGFSFIGDATEDENYPVASQLYKADNQVLNKQLIGSLKNLKRTDLNLVYDKQGILKRGNAVALAYGLQKESISVIQVEDKYQTKLEVTGEIYAFDYSDAEHKLIANFPTGTTVTVTSKNKLTKQEIKDYFENMYLPNKNSTSQKITLEGGSTLNNVFDNWVSRLETVKIERAKKEKRLQIREITLDEHVIRQLSGSSEYIKDKKMLTNETGRNFERNLSVNQNVPVLPFSVGRALGASMIARFADTDFRIKIPDPDMVIDILVREFKKTYVDNRVYDGYVYSAFITLKVIEPYANTIKFESKFNYKDEIQIPKSYKLVIEDDWPLWIGAQKKLFEILSKQISVRDDKELTKITSTVNVKDLLKTFDEIITESR
jgi:hypothetical protein